jgi:hypothetical protein
MSGCRHCQAQLRAETLAAFSHVSVGPRAALGLSAGWEPGVGSQSEVEARFELPATGAAAGRLGVVVMASSLDGSSLAGGTRFWVEFVPGSHTATVGADEAEDEAEGGDEDDGAPIGGASSARSPCPALLTDTTRPAAQLTKHAPPCDRAGATGGAAGRSAGPPGSWPPYTAQLRLLPNETTVTLRIFTDHTMAECFFQGGRTVITRSVGMRGRTKQAGVAVVSNVSVKLEAATAWRVSSIWVPPEDVLAAPRPDRHEP